MSIKRVILNQDFQNVCASKKFSFFRSLSVQIIITLEFLVLPCFQNFIYVDIIALTYLLHVDMLCCCYMVKEHRRGKEWSQDPELQKSELQVV